MSRSFRQRGVTLGLDGSENADLNIEVLEYCKMPSTEEAYEFQLQSESFSFEEEQEDLLFYFISFEIFKKRSFDAEKIALFWF